jgi:hypothetical protein
VSLDVVVAAIHAARVLGCAHSHDRTVTAMRHTLHVRTDGELCEVAVDEVLDVAVIAGGPYLETLTIRDTAIVFWFSPALHRVVNPMATELLLATTRFAARTVPLLRGDIVITSHDIAGNVLGLTEPQIGWLLHHPPNFRQKRILGRRFARDRLTT